MKLQPRDHSPSLRVVTWTTQASRLRGNMPLLPCKVRFNNAPIGTGWVTSKPIPVAEMFRTWVGRRLWSDSAGWQVVLRSAGWRTQTRRSSPAGEAADLSEAYATRSRHHGVPPNMLTSEWTRDDPLA